MTEPGKNSQQPPQNGKEWWEERKNPWKSTTFFFLCSLFIFLCITGAYTFFTDSWSPFFQYSIYFHSYFGLLFFFLFVGFIYNHLARHFKKTGLATLGVFGGLGLFFATLLNHPVMEFFLIIIFSLLVVFYILSTFRGPGKGDKKKIAVYGLLGLVVTLVLSLTGLMILPGAACYKGGRLFYYEHDIAAVLLFAPVFLHLFYFFQKNNRLASPKAKENYSLWSVARKKDMVRALAFLPLLFLPAAYMSFSYVANVLVHTDAASYETDSVKAVFKASRMRTDNMKYISAERLKHAESCGMEGCHVEITRQWNESAHHQSGSTKLYQALIPYVDKASGRDTVRFCSGCHAPVALLTGELDDGKKIVDLNSVGQKEGINCIVCHSITDVDEKPQNASYTVSIQKDYLYDRMHKTRHQTLIKLNPRLHRKIWMRDLYKTPEYCASCHSQYVGDIAHNFKGYSQDQYGQMLKSPFYNEEDAQKSLTCNDCHMPKTDQNFYDDYISDHRFFAAHQALKILSPNNYIYTYPRVNKHGTLFGQWSLYKNPYAELPLNDLANMWLRGEIKIKEISDKWYEGPVVVMSIKAPEAVSAGSAFNAGVISTNKKAAHDFPAGPLDVIETWIELKVTDGTGKTVYHSGFLDKKNYVDPGAHFFVAHYYDKNNKPILLHEIWNLARVEKRSIHSGKSVTDNYTISVPQSAKSPLKITATIKYRKCNQFIMDAVFKGTTTLPVTDVSSAAAIVKLK